jgi:hypothetical protein
MTEVVLVEAAEDLLDEPRVEVRAPSEAPAGSVRGMPPQPEEARWDANARPQDRPDVP